MRRSLACAVVLTAVGALFGAGVAGARPESTLAHRLARALHVPQVSYARTGALALDLRTGTTVFRLHRSLPLEPASNEKLLVTYAALTELGPRFRFHTAVLGQGGRVGTNVWRGSLVLKGYGDPTLSTRRLRQLAAQVRASGITRVTGSVLGDETFFDRERTVAGWKHAFEFIESPPLSALTVNRDVFKHHLSPRPAFAAAIAFKSALAAAGVKVEGRARTGKAWGSAVPIARVGSRQLIGILRFMDRQSDNFTAEMLLKELGILRGSGSSASGAAEVRQVLRAAGVPLAGVRTVDGSGLSVLDRVTARTLVALLRTAWDDPSLRADFFSALAVAGKSGTLEHRLQNPPERGHVHAKTGTTDEASSLSGYVKHDYVFSILQNGSPVASWWTERAQDRFVTVLTRAK